MRNFARALKFSWPYWPRLLLSFLAATMVAVLWSTNLSLIYPVLKIMQDKKTLQQSVDDDIKEDQKKANEPGRLKEVQKKRENIAYLSNYLESHPPEELIEQQLRSSIKDLAKLEGELHELNRKLWWRTQLKAHVVDRLVSDMVAALRRRRDLAVCRLLGQSLRAPGDVPRTRECPTPCEAEGGRRDSA